MDARPATSIGGETADFIGEQWDGWFRPDGMRYFPELRPIENELAADQILKYVGEGWLPPKPFIARDMPVTAFGSCFAVNIERHLRGRGYSTALTRYQSPDTPATNYWSFSLFIKCGEGFVNTFSIRYQFEWLLENDAPDIDVWLKADGRVQRYIDTNREAGRRLLLDSKVFVITLGLSEIAEDKLTGKAMWAGVPKSQWDPARYHYRNTTVAENLDNLRTIVRLIRKNLGDIPVIFTLSPIPLAATFRPISCLTANSVSKAVLRVAVDELMREQTTDENLFYWPSYEIVTGYVLDPFGRTLGDDRLEGRHPPVHVIRGICEAFEQAYCVP